MRMDGSMNIPTVSQAPSDPDFIQNPYEFYREIRALGDFVYWRDYKMVVATTHTAVSALMKHPKLGRAVPANESAVIPEHLKPFREVEAYSLLELEPPQHSRLRRVAMRGFDRAKVSSE